jgi:hydrogenase maturation protease
MSGQLEHAPVLIFTYGNPSRGDDALGPMMYELLEQYKVETSKLDSVDLLTDYQLQIEHAVDLEQREAVLFIDASVSCLPPYDFFQLQAERDSSYTSHAMSPASILAVYQQVNREKPPPAFMLSIRGEKFGLGKDLSAQASTNLQQSFEFVKQLLTTNVEHWV